MTSRTPSPARAAAAAEIRRVYGGREIAGVTWADVERLAAHCERFGIDPDLFPGAHPPSGAGRALRLRTAAFADYTALWAEAEGSQIAAELANPAILLGWHLRQYDLRHETGADVRPRPDDLYWEGISRPYARAAWLALHTAG